MHVQNPAAFLPAERVRMSDMIKELCVDMQSLGVRFPAGAGGRRGGAGPAEGQVIAIIGQYLNVPTQSWFVASSPYKVERVDGCWTLYKHDTPVARVNIPQRPFYYSLKTPSGISAEKVALLHGGDCLASTVYQDCVYWKTPSQCLFCGIGLSLDSGATVLMKDPAEIGWVVAQAAQSDSIRHVTLTTGVHADQEAGARHLVHCVKSIKQGAGLPVHVQVLPPEDQEDLDRLRDAGADTIGIHIETWPVDALQKVAPGKARIGLERYVTTWRRAVEVFGKNQVSSFIIAGLGETSDAIREAAEFLASLGVFPYLLPLRPIPGTALERWRPPAATRMIALYQDVARILKEHNLSSDRCAAGCVRCGACSALRLFEQ